MCKQTEWQEHLLEKAKSDGRDQYISLLELRNTAVDNLGSPAELLMNRHLSLSSQPTHNNFLQKLLIQTW